MEREMSDWLNAVILGVVEGLTEFLPVSSTAHLLLTEKLLGLSGPQWEAFTVLIQLGAILAVVALYFERLLKVALTLHSDPQSRRFALSVLIAFLPAAVIGAALHKLITGGFFENIQLICWALIIGAIGLFAIDRFAPRPRHFDASHYPMPTSLGIGLFQCLAIIPGMSRSGSTIFGAMLLRCDRKSAAEFSFFLAIPTMVGAFTLDLIKQRHEIAAAHAWGLIALGFVISFVVGLVVVKTFIGFIGRYGLGPFVWWRLLVGVAGLIALSRGW
jgi:undecaprenyl-diphosphatase